MPRSQRFLIYVLITIVYTIAIVLTVMIFTKPTFEPTPLITDSFVGIEWPCEEEPPREMCYAGYQIEPDNAWATGSITSVEWVTGP